MNPVRGARRRSGGLLGLLLAVLASAPLFAARAVPPLTFVYGLQGAGALPVLTELHLNTLYLELPPEAVLDLEPCRAQIRAAQSRGLQVVVGLPTTEALGGRVSADDGRYRGAMNELLTCCVSALRAEPGVTAWATGHNLEGAIAYDDPGFRAFLQHGYPSLEALNAAWGSGFRTWLQVTREDARKVDLTQPNHVGRASVDLADYQSEAFGAVMAGWLQAIRAADPDRPVLTGRLTLYRSLAAVPAGYDVVCVSTPPDVLDPDVYGHNPQGLDLARRGGKFQVLAVLRPPPPGSVAYQDDRFRDWVNLAAVHGACGMAVESWDLLQPAYDMEQRFARGRRLEAAIQLAGTLRWGVPVQPTAAVLWEPYASGREVGGQPTYGYIRGFLPGEPAELLWGLRLGSRFGLVDCLTPDDLLDADLARYGVVFMPACIHLSSRVGAALAEYTQSGGAVLTDLGLGAYESGSWIEPPEPWARVLGIAQIGNLGERAGDLRVGTPVPGLPSLRVGQASQGTFKAGTRGATSPATARKSYTVAGAVAEVLPATEALAFAPMSVRFDAQKRPVFSGLQANRFGLGLALFASHALWAHWPLADGLSTALHGDLLARRAAYELDQPGVWQSGVHFSASEDEIVLANLGHDGLSASLWAYKAEGRVFSGAVSRVLAAPVERGYPPGTVRLTVLVPGRGQAVATRVPLQAQPLSDDAAVLVEEYGPTQVRLVVAGSGATVQVRRDSELALEATNRTGVRLTLKGGKYLVAPGSRHLVTRTTRGGQESRTIVTAAATGTLDLSDYFRRDTLVIQPAPAE